MTRILRLHLSPSELTDCYSGTRYLWASAQRTGVRCLLTEDLQDGFMLQSVRFVNPLQRANDRLIRRDSPAWASENVRNRSSEGPRSR
jgi:hypothetical protein